MTFRERYLETLLFGRPDRIPLMPGGPRESTLRVWHQQGLPEGRHYFRALLEELQLPPMPGGVHVVFPFDDSCFEEVLRRTDTT